MGNRNDPKDSHPGYRVQPGATNGPYAWGNGPQPKKSCSLFLVQVGLAAYGVVRVASMAARRWRS